jgi:hypothetical protein
MFEIGEGIYASMGITPPRTRMGLAWNIVLRSTQAMSIEALGHELDIESYP